MPSITWVGCTETANIFNGDYAEALKWYHKAAEQGHAAAQNSLGWMYQKGKGVPQDHAEAVKRYRKSAEQGDEAAQYNLGRTYQKGEGVPQSDAEAVKVVSQGV